MLARSLTLATLLALAAPVLAHAGDDFDWNEDKPKLAYVLIHKEQTRSDHGTETTYSTTGSGDDEDYREAKRLRDRSGRDLLWVRIDERKYVIDDPSFLDRIVDLHEPQQRLGEQQGMLGRQQGRLGERQGELGAQQGKLGARQGRLQSRQAAISAELSRDNDGSRSAALEREMRAVAREQSELSERQTELGRLQSQLGREQSDLGRKQSDLGRLQSELAREIDRKVGELIREAITKGSAQRLS